MEQRNALSFEALGNLWLAFDLVDATQPPYLVFSLERRGAVMRLDGATEERIARQMAARLTRPGAFTAVWRRWDPDAEPDPRPPSVPARCIRGSDLSALGSDEELTRAVVTTPVGNWLVIGIAPSEDAVAFYQGADLARAAECQRSLVDQGCRKYATWFRER